MSPLNRLSSWMYSLLVSNFKSRVSSSMYSSSFLVTGFPFMSIDTFNPAKMSNIIGYYLILLSFKYNNTTLPKVKLLLPSPVIGRMIIFPFMLYMPSSTNESSKKPLRLNEWLSILDLYIYHKSRYNVVTLEFFF